MEYGNMMWIVDTDTENWVAFEYEVCGGDTQNE